MQTALKNLKILHISQSANRGGAAQAAYRLHKGLLHEGLLSNFSVMEPDKSLSLEAVRSPLNLKEKILYRIRKNIGIHGPKWIYPKVKESLSLSMQGMNIYEHIKQTSPDIIHLHWVCNGTLKLRSLAQLNIPIIWTLHDMWPFTGGCYYTGTCSRYRIGCGKCPQIGSEKEEDVTHRLIRQKGQILDSLPLHIVTPSKWMSKCAKESLLFSKTPTVTIPYGIDPNDYPIHNSKLAKVELGLDPDKSYILFLAANAISDPRKGFHLFKEAILETATKLKINHVELLIVGIGKEQTLEEFPIECTTFPYIKDTRKINLLYAAADLFVAPSKEDNLPNTVIEAMASGTPTLAFNIGGMPDMIEHMRTGYLVEEVSASSLTEGLLWFYSKSCDHSKVRRDTLHKFNEEFTTNRQVERMTDLYNRVRASCL